MYTVDRSFTCQKQLTMYKNTVHFMAATEDGCYRIARNISGELNLVDWLEDWQLKFSKYFT